MSRIGPRPAGNAEAILDALTHDQRQAFEEALRVLNMGSRWNEAPGIAAYIELVAWVQLADRLRVEKGLTKGQARNRAAFVLGLDPESLSRRLARQRRYAMRGKTRSENRDKVSVKSA